MVKQHIFSAHSDSSNQHCLTPPDIIVRAGQDAVGIYAELHTTFANARNDQFAVGLSDFLNWLEDLSPGMYIEHIVEDNIVSHLGALAEAGCSESKLSARLCAIDLFLRKLSPIVPNLARLPRSGYARSCPPLLLVESTTEDENFVSVYIDFLASHTNPRTRESYAQGLRRFCDWVSRDHQSARLQDVHKLTGSQTAAFIASISETDPETGLSDDKARTVGTIMSAVRTYLDACIAAGLLKTNVTRAVRLPRVPSGKGSTPVLDNALVARMIEMIPMETEADYRDRAMIAMMAYSLFRISAVCRLRVRDYQMRGNHRYLVTIEKRSKVHEMPVHETLAHYIDDYLTYSGLVDQSDAPLFQGSVPRTGMLTARGYSRNASWKMIQRRAKAAGHFGDVGNHSLRATGITNYLAHGGQLEEARKMAGHKSAETTRLYDRNLEAVDPEEVQRIKY